MSYEPMPGSTAFRVIAHLQSLPKGAELMTSALAEAIGCEGKNIVPSIEAALANGLIFRRQRDTHARSPMWWSLTDHGARPKVDIRQPAVPVDGAKETPQEGANRDASAGQSHDAEGSASPAGRGTNGAPACGAAPESIPAVVLPKPATSPKSHPTHGFSQTPEYRAWQAMVKRCTDPENAAWPDYGGRGITVCDRWRDDVAAFIADMGAKPSALHELDRKDNDGGYEPSNCRWVLRKENNRNRRSNRIVEWNGQQKTLVEWSEITGLAFSALKWRLDSGWPIDRAMTEPSAARPDATDRGTPASASPDGGPTGAGQPAAAGPAGAKRRVLIGLSAGVSMSGNVSIESECGTVILFNAQRAKQLLAFFAGRGG